MSESERNTGERVCETVADAAHGDGETRRQFAEAERTLVAKVPKPPRSRYFTKQAFHIDLEAGRCTCPAGEITTRLHRQGRDRDGYGQRVPRRAFVFEGAVCDGCPLRPQCVKAAPGRGRSVRRGTALRCTSSSATTTRGQCTNDSEAVAHGIPADHLCHRAPI